MKNLIKYLLVVAALGTLANVFVVRTAEKPQPIVSNVFGVFDEDEDNGDDEELKAITTQAVQTPKSKASTPQAKTPAPSRTVTPMPFKSLPVRSGSPVSPVAARAAYIKNIPKLTPFSPVQQTGRRSSISSPAMISPSRASTVTPGLRLGSPSPSPSSRFVATPSPFPLLPGSCDVQVFFTFDDNQGLNLAEQFNRLVDREYKSIKIAIYSFTNSFMANALIRAKKRGVTIEVVVDPGYRPENNSDANEKGYDVIKSLVDNGIEVFEYNPDYIQGRNYMHNKFAIFGGDKAGDARVWTGSFNFSYGATNSNKENAVVIKDPLVVSKFESQFDWLKNNRCNLLIEKDGDLCLWPKEGDAEFYKKELGKIPERFCPSGN